MRALDAVRPVQVSPPRSGRIAAVAVSTPSETWRPADDVLPTVSKPAADANLPRINGVSADTLTHMSAYIDHQWDALRRDPMSAETAADPKAQSRIIYIPPDLKASFSTASDTAVQISGLRGLSPLIKPGLLMLPNAFVTPGGRFNEQYGWDTWFTVRGLIQDGRVDTAKGMIDNQLFQVQHYGKVLNGNRSYYLGRSSPPLLADGVMRVYHAMPQQTAADKAAAKTWLAGALPLVMQDYSSWHDRLHQTDTGLSRYASSINKPCPEVEAGHYAGEHPNWKDDRAERESGWDMTDRWGYQCMRYNPADLNSLLFRYETEIGTMCKELGDPRAPEWEQKADKTRQGIQDLMWEAPGQKSPRTGGLYYDWDLKTHHRSDYVSMATFFPLWAKVATPEQAAAVRTQALKLLETPYGLRTSTTESGKQWDKPYGWAPLQLMAVEALRNYGFDEDADRIEQKFVGMVAKVFAEKGAIYEKYNVELGNADVGVSYGNQEGFAWTNATVHLFMEDLRRRQHGQPPLLGQPPR